MNYMVFFIPAMAALMGLNIWLSKSFWTYHINGTKGFITDQLIYNLSPIVPIVLILVMFYFLQNNASEVVEGPLKYVLMAVGVLGIFFVRRLPPVAAAQERVRAARNARFEALEKQ